MLSGYKTYIVLMIGFIFNILTALGIALPAEITQEKVLATIDTIIALVAFIMNAISKERAAGKKALGK
jgi:hypothetical protein